MLGLNSSVLGSLGRVSVLLGLLCVVLYAGEKVFPPRQSHSAPNRLFEKLPGRPTYSGTRSRQEQPKIEQASLVTSLTDSSHTRILSSESPLDISGEEIKKSSNNSETTEKQESHEAGESLIVYIVSIILLLGGACREIKKTTGMPYTPQLLLIGIILGTFSHSMGLIGQAFELLLNINPHECVAQAHQTQKAHGILMIFIPTIIFESAYNSDPFTTKRQIWQILLLAGPGVVVGAILITLGFNYGLGYSSELSFAGGLTFGAIVCATDPVAVVALLKELGTPAKFNMLLEGESLLNDGTAMVFYIVFSSIFKAQGVTIFGVFFKFLQLSVGGVLLGAIAFVFAIAWIRKIVKDEILTIAITFMACYLAFFIGETYLGVSGILAIVALGVLMSLLIIAVSTLDSIVTTHLVTEIITN